MEIILFILSILAITAGAWLANKFLPFKICPICMGVSGTWVWILVGISAGMLDVESWKTLATLAMGGTAVGVAYQGEKRFKWVSKSIFRFRVPVIIMGFLIAYWVVEDIGWGSLSVALAILGMVFYFYFISPSKIEIPLSRTDAGKVAELEEKLKSCCD